MYMAMTRSSDMRERRMFETAPSFRNGPAGRHRLRFDLVKEKQVIKPVSRRPVSSSGSAIGDRRRGARAWPLRHRRSSSTDFSALSRTMGRPRSSTASKRRRAYDVDTDELYRLVPRRGGPAATRSSLRRRCFTNRTKRQRAAAAQGAISMAKAATEKLTKGAQGASDCGLQE